VFVAYNPRGEFLLLIKSLLACRRRECWRRRRVAVERCVVGAACHHWRESVKVTKQQIVSIMTAAGEVLEERTPT
jgi:hypothetical protein